MGSKENELKDTLVIGYNIDNKRKSNIDRKRPSDDNSKNKQKK